MHITHISAILLSFISAAYVADAADPSPVTIARKNPNPANVVAKNVVSFSVELSNLANYTGTVKDHNDYSRNMLDNLKRFTGEYPVIRAGGNSQDITTVVTSAFTDALKVWSDLKFIMGLNLKTYNDVGRAYNKKLVDESCKILGSNILYWELGNEVDLYGGTWNVTNYVKRWKDFAKIARDQQRTSCPKLNRQFFGPSTGDSKPRFKSFSPLATLSEGQNSVPDTEIKAISTHQYFKGSDSETDPSNITKQLLSHSSVTHQVKKHTDLKAALKKAGFDFPNTIGETNSHTGGGKKNYSDVFGAALWTADYSLKVAAAGPDLTQLYFHQISGSKINDPGYSAWKPKSNDMGGPQTKPPYYGMLFANRLVGTETNSQIYEVNITNTNDFESIYVAYAAEGPKRIAVLNNLGYYGTGTRGSRTYTFNLPTTAGSWSASAERLLGGGVYATEHLSFGGKTYEHGTSNGKPKLGSDAQQKASAAGVSVKGDTLTVTVADTEAVIVHLTESTKPKCKREELESQREVAEWFP